MANDINGMIAGAIPDFGSPTLQGIEFEQGSTSGVLNMKSSSRQHVRFHNVKILNMAKAREAAAKAGRATPNEEDLAHGYENKVHCLVITPGDKNVHDDVATDYHKRAYWKQYKAFMDGKTGPEGQPIDDCEFVQPGEATELKRLEIHTVEQLAEAPELALHQVPRGFELRDYARAWVKAMKGDSAGQVAKKLSAELSETKDVIQKQAEMIEQLRAQMAVMQQHTPTGKEELVSEIATETTRRGRR